MNSTAFCCLEGIRYIFIAFYRWLTKIKINAYQQISYWKSRIRAKNSGSLVNLATTNTNVDLAQHQSFTELHQYSSDLDLNKDNFSSCSAECKLTGLQKRGSDRNSKTPRVPKTKLTSIFRRLSLRNFMDYCVAALNEASSSSCSNKFDLSSCNASVWLMGRRYEMPQQGDQMIEDIKSKLWITYRRDFPPIDENTRYTTDRGFGCMIRCGQMVIANALLCKNLTRDWRWSNKGLNSNPQVYSKVLRMFQDREDCPYSIHRIVQTGRKHEGKNIGEWFGPNTIAQALKKLSTGYQQVQQFDRDMAISIDAALDNIVVIDEIKSKFKGLEQDTGDAAGVESNDNGVWIPGVLFIQLRLGLSKINPLYFDALKKTFRFKNSLGIIGGRPNHALYLVGYTDNDIIYLDPHSTQQYIDLDGTGMENNHNNSNNGNQGVSPTTYQLSPDETYHCSCPEKMSIDRLDPSLALCFYFSSELEFNEWCNLSQELLVKSEQAPMFEITKSRPCDRSAALTLITSSNQDEEFEILT